MGDDLSLPEREALRTPMQWSDSEGAGFSGAATLVRPVIADGDYGYPTVNVGSARMDPESLLSWFQRMIPTLRECPESGSGVCTTVPLDEPAVLVHRMESPQGLMLFVHNLGYEPIEVDVGKQEGAEGKPVEVFSDQAYDGVDLRRLALGPSGFRWLRLRRTTSTAAAAVPATVPQPCSSTSPACLKYTSKPYEP